MRISLIIIAVFWAMNSFAQGVVDVHSHIITPEFVSALESEGRLMDEGFPLPKYNVESHLKWMDEAGVQTSVLTLAAPQPTSPEVVRQTNEAAARIKKEHPDRFLFCAALPLPDVTKAIEEAKYALDVLKADGIKLATNVRNSESHQACLNGRVATDEDEVNVGGQYLAPQVLTQSLARMKKYLSDETDLAPFREMILYQNANQLFK